MLDIVREAKKSLDFTVIERAFRRLNTHPDDVELMIPTKLKGWRMGGEAALIHLISNWAIRSPEPRLVLYASTPEEAAVQFPNLGKTHHGLVALAAASSVVVKSKARTPILATTHKALLAEMFEPLYPKNLSAPNIHKAIPGAWRGERAFFLCSKRHNKEFPSYFYHLSKSRPPRVKDQDDFSDFFGKVVTQQRKQLNALQALSPEVQESIGAIIYELFKNTDEHGRHNISGKPIENSLRGVMVTLHAETASHPLRLAEEMEENPVKIYLNSFKRNGVMSVRDFLEINIFDNGIGLARKWLKFKLNSELPLSELPLQKEIEAVNECWGKYNTTSNRDSKGLGLYRVANTLSECRGFLRLRTGRLSLHRNFAQHSYPDKAVDPAPNLFAKEELSLMDFGTNSINPKDFTELTQVDGLLLTMLIPMGRQKVS